LKTFCDHLVYMLCGNLVYFSGASVNCRHTLPNLTEPN
jgi:hypothetical protein